MTRLMASYGRFAVLLVLGLCTPLAAIAQENTTGSLAGEVVDSQDLAVPGATITVGSEQGTRTYVSNSEGRFLAPYLTPGLFTVRVEMQGFVPVEQRDIKVRLGQRLELRFVMQPGAMTEEVTVLAAPIIDHSSSTVGALLDDQLISSVPVGRRFTDVPRRAGAYLPCATSAGCSTARTSTRWWSRHPTIGTRS